MRKLVFILLIISFFISKAGWATCTEIIPSRNDVFPLQGGNITAGEDLPLGAVLYRQYIHSYHGDNAPHMKCSGLTNTPYYEEQYAYFTNAPLPLSSWQGGEYSGKIYATNIPGIGAVLANRKSGLVYDFNPTLFYSRTVTAPALETVQAWTDSALLLIKTGNISPGVVLGNVLPTVEYQDLYFDSNRKKVVDYKPYKFSFGGSLNVVSQTCKTSDLIVDLGTWDVSKLIRSGYTQWKRADIKLEGCPRFYGMVSNVVTDHITGENSGLKTQKNSFGLILHPASSVINSQQGIMNIDRTGYAASGVGIQIVFGNDTGTLSPIEFDAERKIDAPDDGKTSFIIPLQARYVKTDERITPGAANGHVIFTINYY